MLHFFRRYQKYFFIFITIIIVTTFAFFGTYQVFSPALFSKTNDEVTFHTSDGKAIKRFYLEHMTRFLESEEWMQSAKIFDTNYLNDGVITKDFLENGFAEVLLKRFADKYKEELEKRLEKEKTYQPYRHPYLKMISAENIWALFAPDIPEKLKALKASDEAIESFQKRVDLFLAEKNFPPAFLTQVLRYQERDNASVASDPRLMKDAISLFGYHHHTDWFGQKFVQSIAEVVINLASIARQRGYRVTKEEALTDLLYKSHKTYEALSTNANLVVQNGEELFSFYLRHKGLDQETAICLWQDITLFRRMMQEVGAAAFVDTLTLEQFYSYAHEKAEVDFYQMSEELVFKNEQEAQIFEAYLDAVSDHHPGEIPLEYCSIETIEAKAPELVGKRYHLYVGSVEKKALEARVSVKQTWDWELENLDVLFDAFPELNHYQGTPFERLEQVDHRQKIDAFARLKIVETHPEWIEEALKSVQLREHTLFFTTSNKNELLPGIKEPLAFQKVIESQEEIAGYSQDDEHFYRIIVDERPTKKEILTFKEAKNLALLTPVKRPPKVCFASYLETYRQARPETELAKQWVIERKEKTVSRSDAFPRLDEILTLEIDAFSPIYVDEKLGAYCYQLKQVLVDTTIPMQKWMEVQELLAKESRAQFFKETLDQLCSKNLSL